MTTKIKFETWIICDGVVATSPSIWFNFYRIRFYQRENSSSFCRVIHLFYCRSYCTVAIKFRDFLPKNITAQKFSTEHDFVCDAKQQNHQSILIEFSLQSNRACSLSINRLFWYLHRNTLVSLTNTGASGGGTRTDGTNLISVERSMYAIFLRIFDNSVRDVRFVRFSGNEVREHGDVVVVFTSIQPFYLTWFCLGRQILNASLSHHIFSDKLINYSNFCWRCRWVCSRHKMDQCLQ